MIPITCANCAVVFGLTEAMRDNRKEDHATFYCPNGHANHWPAPKQTEEQKQIAQLRENLLHSSRIIQSRATSDIPCRG